MFDPEYAEVLGVPFTFLTTAGPGKTRKPKPVLTVRSLPERSNLRIEFPRVLGYRFKMPTERLDARFDEKVDPRAWRTPRTSSAQGFFAAIRWWRDLARGAIVNREG
jgi:hypothetical protein